MCHSLNHRQPLPAAACMIPGGYRAVVIQHITGLPCLGSAYLKHCYVVPCPLPFPAFTASQVAYIPKKALTEKEFQSKKTRGSEVHHGSKGREVEVFHLSKYGYHIGQATTERARAKTFPCFYISTNKMLQIFAQINLFFLADAPLPK